MYVYFSTVVRTAPVRQAGEIVCLDWDRKVIQARVPIYPCNPEVADPNPRGSTRGGRGIAFWGDHVVVASYHTLKIFDRRLRHVRDVTHPLFVGIHEVHGGAGNLLWVTATSIDAALEVDPETGQLGRQHWPREVPAFCAALNLTPLAIDKAADNRPRFLGQGYLAQASHLHLNAVASWRGELYAVFNSFGILANLDRAEVVIEDPELKGAHNLVVAEDGTALVNDTYSAVVRSYDLGTRRAGSAIPLSQFPWVRDLADRAVSGRLGRRLVSRLRVGRLVKRLPWLGLRLARAAYLSPLAARPLFLRGLDRIGDRLFVGLSPASILCLNAHTGELLDAYNYSTDLHDCIHGLRVLPS
jgi:hypothetical protein